MGTCVSSLSSSKKKRETPPGAGREKKEEEELKQVPRRMVSNGSSHVASLHTQQGKKGTNQDAMIVWEDFGSQNDTIFCGVFDGHGPYGHFVARKVRNSLPLKISSQLKPTDQNDAQNTINGDLASSMNSEETGSVASLEDEMSDGDDEMPDIYLPVKRAFKKACKLMDKELKLHASIDCFCSGCTSVTVLKQGHDLIIGNIGDSRAVLGTKDDCNRLIPLQLTVDLKPNLPSEEERIKKCKGRVFALQDEPDVARVWLPNNNAPGLAMARAFGDFCLKDYGLISVPDISHYQLTHKDQFLILATDGVWDALSNKDAVRIVASAPSRTTAARALVDCAVRSWRVKYPTSKVDDCAAICLFFDNIPPTLENKKLNNLSVDENISPLQRLDTICGCDDDEIERSLDQQVEEEKEKEDVNNTSPLQRLDTFCGCNEIELFINQEKEPEKAEVNPSPLQRLDTISGCNEIELVIEEEEEKTVEKGSESKRSLAEFMSMDHEEEWSALEGVTRVNSLLSLPRILSSRWKNRNK